MMSILGFFMAIAWLVMPFVLFAVKGKLDRTLELLEKIEKRLSDLESGRKNLESEENSSSPAENGQEKI